MTDLGGPGYPCSWCYRDSQHPVRKQEPTQTKEDGAALVAALEYRHGNRQIVHPLVLLYASPQSTQTAVHPPNHQISLARGFTENPRQTVVEEEQRKQRMLQQEASDLRFSLSYQPVPHLHNTEVLDTDRPYNSGHTPHRPIWAVGQSGEEQWPTALNPRSLSYVHQPFSRLVNMAPGQYQLPPHEEQLGRDGAQEREQTQERRQVENRQQGVTQYQEFGKGP